MFPDLSDIYAPAHTFVIKDDMGTCQNIHEQFAKRAANVLSQIKVREIGSDWMRKH